MTVVSKITIEAPSKGSIECHAAVAGFFRWLGMNGASDMVWRRMYSKFKVLS